MGRVHAIITGHEREMNHVERKYEQYLESRKQVGEIRWYVYEPIKIRLADKTYFTPDFLVGASDHVLEAHEVKALWSTGKPGFIEDARVKVKVAAETAFYMRFIVATYSKRGGWDFEELLKDREKPEGEVSPFVRLVELEDKFHATQFDTEQDAKRAWELIRLACGINRAA